MDKRQADILVGGLISIILLFGFISSAQLLFADDPGMGHMESVPAIHFVGPLLGSLVVATIIGGTYVVVRDRLFPTDAGVESTPVNTSPQRDETDIKQGSNSPDAADSATMRRHPMLDILPDDEEKILEPVLESPGITQVEVCDRSGFSRSKVSQTITDLEQRGLVYRERQGRTYRVYPANDLDKRV